MQFRPFEFSRSVVFVLAGIACLAPAHAQKLDLSIQPTGKAALGRPLPIGSLPNLTIALRNGDTKPLGPVQLTIRLDGLAAEKTEVWRVDGNQLKTTVEPIAAGATLSRTLRLRVETAPLEAGSVRVAAEAKPPGGEAAAASLELKVADCAGAYRARLAAMRETISSPVRDAADELRRADPGLPVARLFPLTGARTGEIARAERLAAALSARRGADPQMSTEWFRFLITRWASELNAYAGQSANPGLCANNYYQIAGYRQGLLPITRHLDATHSAAEAALDTARKEAGGDAAAIGDIARALVQSAGLELPAGKPDAFSALAAARAALTANRRLDRDLTKKLSLAETAALLAEADKRGQKLLQAIEQVLGSISSAHKESCVCAF